MKNILYSTLILNGSIYWATEKKHPWAVTQKSYIAKTKQLNSPFSMTTFKKHSCAWNLNFQVLTILRASKRTWSCNTMTHFAVTVSPPQTTRSQSGQNQEGLPRCLSRRAQSTCKHPHRPKPTFHSTNATSPSNSEARVVSLIPCYQLSFTKTPTGLTTVPPNPLCQHGQQPEDDKHDVLMLFFQSVHLDWAWFKKHSSAFLADKIPI